MGRTSRGTGQFRWVHAGRGESQRAKSAGRAEALRYTPVPARCHPYIDTLPSFHSMSPIHRYPHRVRPPLSNKIPN